MPAQGGQAGEKGGQAAQQEGHLVPRPPKDETQQPAEDQYQRHRTRGRGQPPPQMQFPLQQAHCGLDGPGQGQGDEEGEEPGEEKGQEEPQPQQSQGQIDEPEQETRVLVLRQKNFPLHILVQIDGNLSACGGKTVTLPVGLGLAPPTLLC